MKYAWEILLLVAVGAFLTIVLWDSGGREHIVPSTTQKLVGGGVEFYTGPERSAPTSTADPAEASPATASATEPPAREEIFCKLPMAIAPEPASVSAEGAPSTKRRMEVGTPERLAQPCKIIDPELMAPTTEPVGAAEPAP
jgi:hypothetical protein